MSGHLPNVTLRSRTLLEGRLRPDLKFSYTKTEGVGEVFQYPEDYYSEYSLSEVLPMVSSGTYSTPMSDLGDHRSQHSLSFTDDFKSELEIGRDCDYKTTSCSKMKGRACMAPDRECSVCCIT